MEYTAWSLLVDAGLIGLLLIVGAVLRATTKPIQQLMIPASVLAGILGLILGPNFVGILPFSDQLGTYSSVLIVVVFACLALTDEVDFRRIGRALVNFSSYSLLVYSGQIAVGALVAVTVLTPIFQTPDAFGLLLFTGWAGGFGTAAAVGGTFADLGWQEGPSLAFTSATVGLLTGVVGGIIQAKVGASRGLAAEFKGMRDLPRDIRTGLLSTASDRPRVGTHTFSGGSIESIGFQASVVAAISMGAYTLAQLLQSVFTDITFPLFSLAFILGLVLRGLMTLTHTRRFVDSESLRSFSGAATDLLIVCGISSIVPSLVVEFWAPLLILFVVGLAFSLIVGLVIAPRMLGDGWFERQIFTWGWATGSVATGAALLRIVDPKMKSKALEDYAVAYIPTIPVELAAIAFAPALAFAGAAWAVVGIWGAIAVIALAVPFIAGTVRRSARSG